MEFRNEMSSRKVKVYITERLENIYCHWNVVIVIEF